MANIGFHKELESDERILAETPNFTYVYGKGSSLLGSDMVAKLYLTNKRFILLTLAAMESGSVPLSDSEKTDLAFEKSEKAQYKFTKFMENVSNAIGDARKAMVELTTKGKSSKNINFIWLDLPVSNLKNVKVSGKELTVVYDTLKRSWMDIFRGKPMFTFRVETPDIWRIQLESFIQDHHNKRKEIDLQTKNSKEIVNCEICGSEYEKGFAKIVKCDKCGRYVCREKKIKKLLASKWEKTDCFNDDDGLCRRCA